MAEIRLYLGNSVSFLELIDEAMVICDADWQPGTFLSSLKLLTNANIEIPGLQEGISKLEEAVDLLS